MNIKIGLVEPFYGGSHKLWCDGLVEHSHFRYELFTLPSRHWKWRMHGGAVSLARQVNAYDNALDLLICSDMLDVALFKSLLKKELRDKPTILYMHENQLNYPWSQVDKDVRLNRDLHYAFINYASTLVTDFVWFNSYYHLSAFISELPMFLKGFPDYQNTNNVQVIASKSEVVPIGISAPPIKGKNENKIPKLVWNHRWEYDKNPDDFFKAVITLKNEGIRFELVVLGEHTNKYPPIFDEAKEILASHIVHWGYCDSKSEYFDLLSSCDFALNTSNQDFFGISAVEAILCGVTPLLPNRLAFPEHIPEHLHAKYLYNSDEEMIDKLRTMLVQPNVRNVELIQFNAERYKWGKIAAIIDQKIESIVKQMNR